MSGMRRECGMPAICGRQPRENSTRNADGRGKTSGSSSSSSPSSSLVLLVVVVVVAVLVNVVVFVVAPLVVVVGVAVAVAIQPRWCCWRGLLLLLRGMLSLHLFALGKRATCGPRCPARTSVDQPRCCKASVPRPSSTRTTTRSRGPSRRSRNTTADHHWHYHEYCYDAFCYYQSFSKF